MTHTFFRSQGVCTQVSRWITSATLLWGALLTIAPTFAEEANPANPAPKITRTSLWDQLVQGGPVMIVIAVCSIVMIWLIVDGWMRTGYKRLAPPPHVEGTRDLFRMGDYVGAYQHCKNNPSAFCDTTRVALSFCGDGQEATEDAMTGELARVSAQIQTRINYLSVIGVCAPMIGLLGTVTGMIKAFQTLGSDGLGDPTKLSAAIGEVLVATASGLFIAIPAFFFYYILRNKLQGSMHKLQDTVVSLFRKMPYEHLKDTHVGEEEFYAATPNWVGAEEAGAAPLPVG
jgi:biopolymer transport protein ExbB